MSPTASWSPVGSAPAALAAARDLFDPPMRAAVARLAPAVRDVAGYHFGWTDADGSVRASNSGKAVRPTLAVVSAQAVGAPAEVGVPGALAVEFVHNFSLLHDDVMDRDEERRHRPTAWTVFGNSAAILAGDALLALAFEALLDVAPERSRAAQRSLAAATQQLIVGQVDDLDFEQRLDVGVEECLQMAAGKTAALMACSASIGARLGAAGADVVQALEGFG
ncbi:MAG: geranylgeranyl diphosphate synthase, type, partial [Actinomycetota bacterium]|nr:geranylgeranyl diphosphate synthase, type [Actinomycetota bacterium]